MKSIRLQPSAVGDAGQAADWYEAQQPGLGTEFILELDAAIERAAQNPETYAVQYKSARRVLLRRSPYSVYVALDQDGVEIFAILHQHRDPISWQERHH